MFYVGINISLHSMMPNVKSSLWKFYFVEKGISSIRFEGQRQPIEHYGDQDSKEKYQLQTNLVSSGEHQAPKKPADDDDNDVDLFGDDDEAESEQTKQRLAAYAEKKSKSNHIDLWYSILIFRS